MGIVAAVSDFDNTITREVGLESFFAVYQRKFLETTGMDPADYEKAIAEVRRDMAADPVVYGWKDNGFFSAPVKGDPIGSNTVAHINLMRRLTTGVLPEARIEHAPKDERDVQRIKELCYLSAHEEKSAHYRDGAANYLNSLRAMFSERAAVMSNSYEDSIRKKLRKLEGFEVGDMYLIGPAEKMIVGSQRGQVQPDGFPVPINPDRPAYLRKLWKFMNPKQGDEEFDKLYEANEVSLDGLEVIGDNFFLDIATVLLHGGYGVLLETEATQGYEIPFLEAHPRGCFARNYDEALEFTARHKEIIR